MALMYAVSGITIIRSDEVAIIKRWGRLVGDIPATQQHGPGLLFAMPRPIDEVVRVKTKYIHELPVRSLFPTSSFPMSSYTLDPITDGYALTGDLNILHVGMVARYRVSNPVEFAFYSPDSEVLLRSEASSAMIRSLGEMGIDEVLAEKRKDLIKNVEARTQEGLDSVHSGLELVSIELTDLSPPRVLIESFEEVQSAYIEVETKKKEAAAYVQDIIPKARASANDEIQSANGARANDYAVANGDANAFLALEKEYRVNPAIVREQLYRENIEKLFSSNPTVTWVPPPINGHYKGFRVLLTPRTTDVQSSSRPVATNPTNGSKASRQAIPEPPPYLGDQEPTEEEQEDE